MQKLRPYITIPLVIIAIVIAVANRHTVSISLWPLPWDVSLPLFVLILVTFALGVIAGGMATWTGRRRREKRRRARREQQGPAIAGRGGRAPALPRS